ncbi:MAG: penicillin acylase family protein [Myxococcota bacterium]
MSGRSCRGHWILEGDGLSCTTPARRVVSNGILEKLSGWKMRAWLSETRPSTLGPTSRGCGTVRSGVLGTGGRESMMRTFGSGMGGVAVAVWAAGAMGLGACGDDHGQGDVAVTDAQSDGDTSADALDGSDDVDTTEPGDGIGDGADTGGPTADQQVILAVPESERWQMAGLTAPVYVVRTEGNIPNVYAENELDLARVLGFVQARDRFFFMDVQRRLGTGRLAALLGDLALGNDIESRNTALPYLTDRLVAHMSPAFQAYLEAFVAGVNRYIDEVRAGTVVAPSETQYASLLGFATPADMLEPFTVRDMMALVAVVMWSTNFGSDDVGQTSAALHLDGLFDGVLDGELRKSGFLSDIYNDVRPMYPGTNSADGFGLTGRGSSQTGGALSAGTRRGTPAKVPVELVDQLLQKLRQRELQLGKDVEAGFGSNAWAVMGEKTRTARRCSPTTATSS